MVSAALMVKQGKNTDKYIEVHKYIERNLKLKTQTHETSKYKWSVRNNKDTE